MEVEDSGSVYNVEVKDETYSMDLKVDTCNVEVKVEINRPGKEDPGSVTAEERPESNDDGAASPQTLATTSGRASPQSSAATASSDRTTRQRHRWSNPSDNRPPSTTTAQQPRRARKRRSGCGRDACGEEGPEGVRVCSACNRRPNETAKGPRWTHFQSDETMADAASIWARLSSALPPSSATDVKDQSSPIPFKTDVKEGFTPSRDNCLCIKGTCFFAQVAKRRKLEGGSSYRCCAVCASLRVSSWRHPGSRFKLYDRYFTLPHARYKTLHLNGGRLDAESWLCNRCSAEGYRKAELYFRAHKSTVEGYLNFLELHRSTPNKDTLAFTEHVTLLYLLRRLKGGELVCLPDALDFMRSTREESGLRSINEESLGPKVLGMFKDLSRCIVDANHLSFDGDAVGDGDKRQKAHYLMPSMFNPRYVASLHRQVCRLAKKETKTQVRRKVVVVVVLVPMPSRHR